MKQFDNEEENLIHEDITENFRKALDYMSRVQKEISDLKKTDGYKAQKNVIKAVKDIVSSAYFPEDEAILDLEPVEFTLAEYTITLTPKEKEVVDIETMKDLLRREGKGSNGDLSQQDILDIMKRSTKKQTKITIKVS